MLAGADSIDDLNIARHSGMRSLFTSVYAPSTIGSFLRTFTHGHVRQLQAAARDTLVALAALLLVLSCFYVLMAVLGAPRYFVFYDWWQRRMGNADNG